MQKVVESSIIKREKCTFFVVVVFLTRFRAVKNPGKGNARVWVCVCVPTSLQRKPRKIDYPRVKRQVFLPYTQAAGVKLDRRVPRVPKKIWKSVRSPF